jgi:hypothetical protein
MAGICVVRRALDTVTTNEVLDIRLLDTDEPAHAVVGDVTSREPSVQGGFANTEPACNFSCVEKWGCM